MVSIKTSGAHDDFKLARSLAAFSKFTYSFKGGASAELCDRIAAGVLLDVGLESDEALRKDTDLLHQFCTALKSTSCRLRRCS